MFAATNEVDGARSSARVILFDSEGRLVLMERRREGRDPYLTVVGGGISPDESIEAAAIRECFEELGATISLGPVMHVAYLPMTGGQGVATQTFFVGRLLTMDWESRTGHEFTEPGRGTYAPAFVALGDPRLANLLPVEVSELLLRYGDEFTAVALSLVA